MAKLSQLVFQSNSTDANTDEDYLEETVRTFAASNYICLHFWSRSLTDNVIFERSLIFHLFVHFNESIVYSGLHTYYFGLRPYYL